MPRGLKPAPQEQPAGRPDLRGTRLAAEAGDPRRATMGEKDGELLPLLCPHLTLQ